MKIFSITLSKDYEVAGHYSTHFSARKGFNIFELGQRVIITKGGERACVPYANVLGWVPDLNETLGESTAPNEMALLAAGMPTTEQAGVPELDVSLVPKNLMSREDMAAKYNAPKPKSLSQSEKMKAIWAAKRAAKIEAEVVSQKNEQEPA